MTPPDPTTFAYLCLEAMVLAALLFATVTK